MTKEELIQSAKNLYNVPGTNEALKVALEESYPEIHESEDERVRKFLVQHISEWIGCIEHDLTISSKDIESEKELAMFKDALAYLENQKEQKPAECLKPEKGYWYVCIKDFYCGGKKQSSKGDLVQDKGGMYMMGREDISEWFRKAYYDEIKPTEWSEEDEKMLKRVILIV